MNHNLVANRIAAIERIATASVSRFDVAIFTPSLGSRGMVWRTQLPRGFAQVVTRT
ncbi:hypothetical protein [Oceaniovalibus sp. ACAM 378]|jgi:hypothetical protein|uniref:hypothetical protein n=1 Tax=Oceaniovalibus sp. ACAM 378 TaxID=2599923 RepID=UPI0016528763|nr:hypothetical protein [Oceaniovalibus sp. ACAM 378]